jgi:class 3 adenylate cyclase
MSEGGPLAALFAATYPERTTALILYGTYPRVTETPDWPGIPEAEWQRSLDEAETDFPNSLRFEQFAPSLVGDPAARARWSTLTRMSASPGSLRALLTMIGQTDVRAALPTITVPTLVLHRRGDRVVPFLCAEYLAAVIPGARLVALPGDDHYVCGDLDPWLGAIEEFLTGTRQQAVLNRVLATVVFTDIVDSTDHVARLGDDAWRRVLDQHDAAMHQTAAVHFGRVIKTLGDGGLVTFDGPARAVRFAADFMGRADALGLRIRAGVHTGEVELRGEDVGGMAVHIAARVAGLAGPNEILSSRTVKDLTAGSGLNFTDRGEHTLKGVPEPWQIYAVA